jgi:hypothetical protein
VALDTSTGKHYDAGHAVTTDAHASNSFNNDGGGAVILYNFLMRVAGGGIAKPGFC